MFIADRLKEVLPLVKPPFRALLLYGSCARGDANEASDVDILQITEAHTPPYSLGSLNVTCYTLDQLLRIARGGGLFARHLIHEAVPLVDGQAVLEALKSAYAAPINYDVVRDEVRGCAPLLDVKEDDFNENPKGLSSLVSYLVRTHLYALAFDQGAESFAMDRVIELLGQQEAKGILSNVKHQTFSAFAAARCFFENLTGVACERAEQTVEAFIVNARGRDTLAEILGLRLLARGRPFTYDVLQEVEL